MTALAPTETDITWMRLLSDIHRRGESIVARGQGTAELLGTVTSWDMAEPVLNVARRKIGYRYMAAEAAWVLSGDNRLSTIARHSPIVGAFSDDGIRFSGAYGPRIVDQLSYVVDVLRKDKASRQAVIGIWRDRPRASGDIACTLSLQFLVRGGDKLHCFSTMRSNDVWLGTPYDVFTFSAVAAAVLIELQPHYPTLRLGRLHHRVASHHLYDRNYSDAHDVIVEFDEWRTDGEPIEMAEAPSLTSAFSALSVDGLIYALRSFT